MSHLPVEDPEWRDDFKNRISLERSIIRMLIQWGFTDSAFEIYRTIEERFNDALEIPECAVAFRLSQGDRVQIGEALRERYLRTRQFPRRRSCKELLQRGLLTGFEELSAELIRLFEQRLQRKTRNLAADEAA
jgi:hypothetical protein